MKDSRYWAYKGIFDVYNNKGYSNIVIDNILKESNMNKNDKALCTTIFYGVIERKISLNYIISKFSNIRLDKISNKVLILLQIGIYQIIYMDKVPNFSAVNETVNLAKKLKLYSCVGFVNAILRNILRNIETNKSNNFFNNIENKEIIYSCNKELIKILIDSYGEDITNKILESSLNRSYISARVNILKTSTHNLINDLNKEGVQANESILKNAIVLKKTGSLNQLESFKKGNFHIENLSSQICCDILDPRAGERVLDACSAPGGKAFSMAEAMLNKGKIIAFDLYESKIDLIKKGANRLGIKIIEARANDSSEFNFTEIEKFDKVLCDVPCSGLGVIKKKPEIKYKESKDIDGLPEIQYKILSNVKEAVKVGGKLIYSTCTLNKKENNDIANRFLDENKDFEPVEIKLPERINRVIEEKKNQLTIMPFGEQETDGFFISVFMRVK